MSHYTVHTINAFTAPVEQQLASDISIQGNPAGVCLLSEFPDDSIMLAIAEEMNLSETAFLVKRAPNTYDLRWFTPTEEVPLCGHATIAAAHYLKSHAAHQELNVEAPIAFHTTFRGVLNASLNGEQISLTMPKATQEASLIIDEMSCYIASPTDSVTSAIRSSDNYLVEVPDMDALRSFTPNLEALKTIDRQGLIVTCRGEKGYDYAYRYFCPKIGIDEDPVTGAANCTLAPYWAGKLAKTNMRAYQASERGGELSVSIDEHTVTVGGKAKELDERVIGAGSLLSGIDRGRA